MGPKQARVRLEQKTLATTICFSCSSKDGDVVSFVSLGEDGGGYVSMSGEIYAGENSQN